jgi:hypothetical protein
MHPFIIDEGVSKSRGRYSARAIWLALMFSPDALFCFRSKIHIESKKKKGHSLSHIVDLAKIDTSLKKSCQLASGKNAKHRPFTKFHGQLVCLVFLSFALSSCCSG